MDIMAISADSNARDALDKIQKLERRIAELERKLAEVERIARSAHKGAYPQGYGR